MGTTFVLLALMTIAILINGSKGFNCYDADTFAGETRPTTQVTCSSVCYYKESAQISGYEQGCTTTSYCTSYQQDTTLWKNVQCCTSELCNAVPSGSGNQPGTNHTNSGINKSPGTFVNCLFTVALLIAIMDVLSEY